MDCKADIIDRLTKKYTKKSQIMDYVQSIGGTIRRKDLVKFIVELKGMKFNPIKHRGYWSVALQSSSWSWRWQKWIGNPGYLMRMSKNEPRHLVRIAHGVYQLMIPVKRPKYNSPMM